MDEVVVRVHEAARLALVRGANGETRWVPYAPPDNTLPQLKIPATASSSPVHLQHKTTSSSGAGRLDLDTSRFPGNPHFSLAQVDKCTAQAQNLLLFLHGRGDSHEPFARLGEQMALPQTAVVSLRAPRELPFGFGFSWIDDIDANGDVIPPDTVHKHRSESLQTATDYVWNFLRVLHDQYEWSYSRLFVFAFSQGACVAFHLAMTLPRDVQLGGVVLVSGGAIVGPHSSSYGKGSAPTPMLQVTGETDKIYPTSLAVLTHREFKRRHTQKAAEELFTSLLRPHKGHAMIDSREDMQHVMLFFSKYLYLRNIELENRSDVIELET
ncbi:PhosphoLipase/carboxylesterase [Phytophthora megakarya]|uniref:PhosphoLipase/carboxylesterase n=1 Tax=Phytophthora megakarya TaxID=4795 RepID=A0A225WPW3_9STRA|nr:PhosphoLipase/carboxylesterase [Phytophthora megakarya]